MYRRTFVFLILFVLLARAGSTFSVTLPAGAIIEVKTASSIWSHERRGRTFKATLDHNIADGKKVLLPGGTPCELMVTASRGDRHKTSPLTLDLTHLVVNGKKVEVKTTMPIEVEPTPMTGRQRHHGHSVGDFTFSRGMKLQFHLARPVTI